MAVNFRLMGGIVFIRCCLRLCVSWVLSLSKTKYPLHILIERLEDLKVLRRSPELLNNVKTGQGQLQLIMEQILFLP